VSKRDAYNSDCWKEKKMVDFKLISADGHINEPPAAWERVQKEYGDRAPKVVKDPEGFKGIWVITDGLPLVLAPTILLGTS